MFSKLCKHSLILAGGIAAVAMATSGLTQAQDMRKRPSLVITNDPLPMDNAPAQVYRAPVKTPEITASQISGNAYFQPTQTIVAKKVTELRSELTGLRSKVSTLSSDLRALKERGLAMSSEYNASVATINTQLQSGTTPGNPRLVEKLGTAQSNLDRMSQNVAELNGMAVEAANAASMGPYLLEATRSAYGLSGAVEEDHVDLAKLEDEVNTTIVGIDRVLNEVNDDITRTAAYLSSERNNIRTLSLAVTNGDYYGRSLAGRPFSSAGPSTLMQPASLGGNGNYAYNEMPSPATPSALSSPRPLVKIKFDQPNVNYEQATYMAVSEAIQRYPSSRLELIAVHPSQGNAAQIAIESTRSRRNAETVLRSLTQMGVDAGKIDLSTMESADARTSEVHIFIR